MKKDRKIGSGVVILIGLTVLGTGTFSAANEVSAVAMTHEIVGKYEGEIRLQSFDGKVDRQLIPDAQIDVDLQGEELVIKSSSELMGLHCQSRVGGIREMMTFSADHPQVLRAVFDFDPKNCTTKNGVRAGWDSLVIFVGREPDRGLTLETVLTRGPINLEANTPPLQPLNVHGIFNKKTTQLTSSG